MTTETTDKRSRFVNDETLGFLKSQSESTKKRLMPLWVENMRVNEKNRMWEKHGSIKTPLVWGIGKKKAVIGIGSGPSLAKNIDVFKRVYNEDIKKKDRNFIFCVPNHQYKPMLEMGIVPDFVFLLDAAPTLYDQLCRDIPKNGKKTVLVAAYSISHRIASDWTKQGRKIRFFCAGSKEYNEQFEKITGKSSTKFGVTPCGNVFNGIWMIGVKVFGSKVFIGIGNDLSFSPENFYADGDYSSNLASGRNEGASKEQYLSFKIITNPAMKLEVVAGDVVGTAHSFFVYKTWMEESMLILTRDNPEYGLHYFNCTEGGILGVMTKTDKGFYMLDTVCPRWHTTTLSNAVSLYLRAKG